MQVAVMVEPGHVGAARVAAGPVVTSAGGAPAALREAVPRRPGAADTP